MKILSCITLSLLSSLAVEARNLLENGSFEDPAISNAFATFSSIPGWEVAGNVDFITAWDDALPSSGSQFLDLDGTVPGTIEQTVSTISGRQYVLALDILGTNDLAGDGGRESATISVSDTQGEILTLKISDEMDVASTFRTTFAARNPFTMISISSLNSNARSNAGLMIDNVKLVDSLEGNVSEEFQFDINPKSTYLRTHEDDAEDPLIVDLDTLGFSAGDIVILRSEGTFSYTETSEEIAMGVIGCFSATSGFNPICNSGEQCLVNRIQQPIASRLPPVVTGNTNRGNNSEGFPTDIEYDGTLNNVAVRIPEGAQFLFVSVSDEFFSDNLDSDGDLRFLVTRVCDEFIDADNDSRSDLLELIEGTDYRNRTSLSTLELSIREDHDSLSWQVFPYRDTKLETSTNLKEWTLVKPPTLSRSLRSEEILLQRLRNKSGYYRLSTGTIAIENR